MSKMGLGLRAPHIRQILSERPEVAFFEVISENFMGLSDAPGGGAMSLLEKVREAYPITMHGVSLSVGSADRLDLRYLKKLRDLTCRIEPLWVSDHICWTGVDGENLHDLLPLPYTEEALVHLVNKVHEAQDFLQRPLILENISAYVGFAHSTLKEWDFLNELCRRTGCGLLLDINNVYVSATNLAFDADEYLLGLNASNIRQFHLAGHSRTEEILIDTHDEPVHDEVWALFKNAVRLFGPRPALVEWDANIPSFETLYAEGLRATQILEDYENRRHLPACIA